MFYHLIYPLHEYISVLNVFRYITVRSAYAAITALLLSFLLGPFVVKRLRQFQIRQSIRKDGPSTHLLKEGTPTMGGILIVTSIVVPTLLWGNLSNQYVLLALLATVWLGALGFLDDYLLVVKKYRKGLTARYKFLGQVILGLLIGSILYFRPAQSVEPSITSVPFLKDVIIDFGIFYIPFVALVITASSNAVNFADGLDGLASGLVAFVGVALGGIAYLSGHVKFSGYLNILYLNGCGELTVFGAAVVGAALGFLWFNCHPADVFMGDTGSLALGGSIGVMAVLIKKELLLAIVGGIFVAEVLSVIIQVIAFKTRGKRVFKMAPLHHHFELMGWPESRVVVRFWIVAALLALVTLSTLKLQ
ncbi:MAG: phospho-N-acetylmuramoyl-pentapeptide-transferase [Candidatus Eisenbacteria bacterium]|nr:phospho-N-acetylmuramoyl-pentapeptide-transferase [Candidatus Eisenbacteria bacterium]